MSLKKLWRNRILWYRIGIFDIILGFIAKDMILVIIGMVLIYLYRDKGEKNDG